MNKKIFHTLYEDSSELLAIGALLFVTTAAFFLARRILVPWLRRVLARHPNKWSRAFEESSLIFLIPHLVSPLVAIFILRHFLIYSHLNKLVIQGISAYLALAITWGLRRAILFVESLITPDDEAYTVSLHSSAQFLSLLIVLGGIGVSVCLLLRVSPLMFLGSLGAATAVLTIIFKDTLMALVTTLQISFNRLIKKNDRISIESLHIDGVVADINLNFIKIKSADGTVTILPTFKLFDAPFKSWSEFTHAEVRHLQGAIFLDQSTITLLDETAYKRYEKNPLISALVKDIKSCATNSDLFRHYVENWLRSHPRIYKKHTILVKFLNPTPQGAPLEIWAFTKEPSWEEHERVKSSVLEMIIALLPLFNLKIHQAS